MSQGNINCAFPTQASDIQSIVQQSWEHGVLRATQGFEPTEIAREYHLLRQVIFFYFRGGSVEGKICRSDASCLCN